MTYQAAVFDMDGLLLDTEKVAMQAFRDACEYLSLPMLEDVYLKIIGCNAEGIKNIICAGYGPSLNYPQLRTEWMRYYHAVVEHQAIPKKEGVIALLNWLKAENIPVAVATSSERKQALIKLELSGLSDYFEHMSTGCEVEHGKPAPDIFLLAAKRLNIAPEKCIAFEDSNNGVRAAVAAKMQVYQIPDLVLPDEEVIALKPTIKNSLIEVLAILKASINS